jgi:hypothetical protein
VRADELLPGGGGLALWRWRLRTLPTVWALIVKPRLARAPTIRSRSYWIPGSYAPTLSENHDSLLRLWKNKGFKEEKMAQVGLYAIGTSTTLESNKSLSIYGATNREKLSESGK